jgi:hypothetical protein
MEQSKTYAEALAAINARQQARNKYTNITRAHVLRELRKANGVTKYVQRESGTDLETVDEVPYNTREERAEAKRCVSEYNISDPTAHHYLSPRACKGWSD